MSLMDHLEELRRRIFRALAVFVVAFLICWSFAGRIYDFLAQPIYRILPEGTKLVFLGITDPFVLYVKVAALAGTFLASPFILYQLWAFVAPGLYRRERRMATPFIFFGSLLFLAGGAFAYYVAFPFAVDFLLGMGAQFQPTITVTRYLGFLMTIVLGLGLMFELPTVIFLLSRVGLVTPVFLLRHFRWAVLVIFIVAAVITPTPDVVNLCIFAVPTILLYLLGVAVAALYGPRATGEEELTPLGITHYAAYALDAGAVLGVALGLREILLHGYLTLGFWHATLTQLRSAALRAILVAVVAAIAGLTLWILLERLSAAGLGTKFLRLRPATLRDAIRITVLVVTVGTLATVVGLRYFEVNREALWSILGPAGAVLVLLAVHLGFARANEEGTPHPYPALLAPLLVVVPILVAGVAITSYPFPFPPDAATRTANAPLLGAGVLLYALVYLMIRRPRGVPAATDEQDRSPGPRSPRALAVSVVVLVILGALAVMLDRPRLEVKRPANVVLIGIDTLRWDHTSLAGAGDRDLTPHLRELADSGTVFTQAVSQAPWTMPAFASIITGKYPPEHGAISLRGLLRKKEVTLAELLREAGYSTGAVVSHLFVDSEHGFSQGVDWFREDQSTGHKSITSAGVSDLAIDFLRQNQKRPFFLFAHYFDPHWEYQDHPDSDFADSYSGRLTTARMDYRTLGFHRDELEPEEVEYLRALYAEEIVFTDREIGRLLAALEELALNETTAVVMVADHGEEFLEHGWLGHTTSLYEEVVHVPLIVRLPAIEGTARVDAVVETKAIFATLIDYLGLDWDGHEIAGSLLPAIRGDAEADAGAWSSVWLPDAPVTSEKRVKQSAYREGDWKLIWDHAEDRFRLFDLGNDPQETDDLAPVGAEPLERLRSRLVAWVEAMEEQVDQVPIRSLSKEETEQLRALGYLP